MATERIVKKNSLRIKKPLAICVRKGLFFLFFKEGSGKNEELKVSTSKNGETFSTRSHTVDIRSGVRTEEDISRCKDFNIFCHGDNAYMTYVRVGAKEAVRMIATSSDMVLWKAHKVENTAKGVTALVPSLSRGAPAVLYSAGNVLRGDTSADLKKWKKHESLGAPSWHFFEGAHFGILGAALVSKHIALLYETKVSVDILSDNQLSDEKIGEERYVKIGVALFSADDPTKLHFSTDLPFLELPFKEHSDHFIGVVPIKKEHKTFFRIYAVGAKDTITFFEIAEEVLLDHRERPPVVLLRHNNNPIIVPTEKEWEVGGAFNPAALRLNGKVHLLYRAVGSNGFSYIGYASSSDGVSFDERSETPVYFPRETFEGASGKQSGTPDPFSSGGSWGGCEDPKITHIGDRIYMTYVAHAGYWPTRTALTSIHVDDFLKKNWKWSKPMLMSPPNVGSKSVVILPELLNGKYVIFHRRWPNIIIDTVPELIFGEGKRWLSNQKMITPRRSYWDSRKLSMSAPPLKTAKGWIAIYNAVDRHDSSRYKAGAMLLKKDDPTEVLARTRKPILSPDVWYENDGKPGIVYPGGAVEMDGMLYVYYGGGDKVSCVATIATEEMLWHLEKDTMPKLTFTEAHY